MESWINLILSLLVLLLNWLGTLVCFHSGFWFIILDQRLVRRFVRFVIFLFKLVRFIYFFNCGLIIFCWAVLVLWLLLRYLALIVFETLLLILIIKLSLSLNRLTILAICEIIRRRFGWNHSWTFILMFNYWLNFLLTGGLPHHVWTCSVEFLTFLLNHFL